MVRYEGNESKRKKLYEERNEYIPNMDDVFNWS